MTSKTTHKVEKHSVLFICAANQCRSVMAEYALKSLVKSRSLHPDSWRIESAGVHAFNGMNATPFALQAVKNIKEDASNHFSRVFTCELGSGFSLILCMQRYQQYLIQNTCPSLSDRAFLISELEGKTTEIGDPVGFSLSTYQETMDLILAIIDRGWSRLEILSSLHN